MIFHPRLAKMTSICEASASDLFSRGHAVAAAASSELEGPLGARALMPPAGALGACPTEFLFLRPVFFI